RVEGAQVRLEGPSGDQPPGGRGPPEGDERHRVHLLEDERIRDDHRQGTVPDGAPHRLPEVQVTPTAMFPLCRFRVEDDSMRPALAPGDYVLVNRWAYKLRPPAKGDLVVVRDPEFPERFLVKRISDFPEAGQVRVVGDNAERSRDSRAFGPVARREIVGKVWF